MGTRIEDLLDLVRALPLGDQIELAARIAKEVETKAQAVEANLAIVNETRGKIKGLGRETIIALAEDEELCGY